MLKKNFYVISEADMQTFNSLFDSSTPQIKSSEAKNHGNFISLFLNQIEKVLANQDESEEIIKGLSNKLVNKHYSADNYEGVIEKIRERMNLVLFAFDSEDLKSKIEQAFENTKNLVKQQESARANPEEAKQENADAEQSKQTSEEAQPTSVLTEESKVDFKDMNFNKILTKDDQVKDCIKDSFFTVNSDNPENYIDNNYRYHFHKYVNTKDGYKQLPEFYRECLIKLNKSYNREILLLMLSDA